MKKHKGAYDLTQRRVQDIYRKKLKKRILKNDSKNIIIFVGVVIFLSVLLAVYEVIFH